jgi:pyruvate dehydrogenase E2 component (dihydrolipoamide acetyltransferase)
MEEGTVLQWLVAEGDRVEVGQPLVEIETDKATVIHEADAAGVVLALQVGEGATVPLGAPIAMIGEPGEELPRAESAEAVAAASSAEAAAEGNASAPPAVAARGSTSAPALTADGSTAPQPTTLAPRGGRAKASPLARRLAAQLKVNLHGLAGSGPNGRVIRADVERAAVEVGDGAPSGALATGPTDVPRQHVRSTLEATIHAKGETAVHELSRLERTVARRMSESRATVPDFELRSEVDMSEIVELRERLGEVTDPLPSYNDFIVKAVALALRQFPRVNGAYRDATVETYSRVNIGVAVAADEALVVPTIFDADRLSLGEIGRKSRELAGRVRDGSIAPADLGGATFTVSNLGMYGVDSFSAVINPPQAAILAVGSLKPRAIVQDDGNVVAGPTIVLTLACDHRVLYGADGARFLARVRELLERPDALIL